MASLDALGNKQSAYAISGENIITVAHELGHVFGSPHTHNCSWPAGPGGTLAPIDQCATVEGDCDITEIIPQEGTIMSYCLTKTQTFGSLVHNLIRARSEVKLGTGETLVSTVTGKVTSNGSGVPDVKIFADRGDGNLVSTTTMTDGSYSLNLFYDDYNITADRDGFLIKPIGTNSGSIYVIVADAAIPELDFIAIELKTDQFEPDDYIDQAALIPADGNIQHHTLHNVTDRDFVRFDAISGKSYLIELFLGEVLGSPTLSLFDTNRETVLQMASYPPSMVWQAPQTGTYYLQASGTKGFYGVLIALTPFLEVATDVTPLQWCDANWGDYDMDEDFDLLISGRDDNFNPKIVFFKNDNGNLIQTEAGIEQISTSSNIFVKWVDIDNDGDLDAFTGGGNFAYIHINNGGSFTSTITIDNNLVELQSTAFGDYDNDGDLDILIQSSADINNWGDVALIHLYRNDHGDFQNINLGLRGVRFGKAIWGDFDQDGDLDILVTGSSNRNGDPGSSATDPFTKVYKNEHGSFSDANISIVPVASFPDLALGDYDNDGDLDLVIAGEEATKLVSKIYRNDNGVYTDINAGLTGVRNANLAWVDYDNDGDLDLIISGDSNSAFVSPLTRLYINQAGKFEEAYFNSILPGICSGVVKWSDYDNDSDLDLLLIGLSSNWKGQANLLRNETNVKNVSPSAPTDLNALVEGSKVTLSWIQAQDDRTPSEGLSYNLYIGTTPAGSDVLAPMSDLKTGMRQIVEIGNVGQSLQHSIYNLSPETYYWSVQAIDNGFKGSAWSPEKSFTVCESYEIFEDKAICKGDTYKGWSSEGQYMEGLHSITGCDSTVITNLSFYPSKEPEIIILGDTLLSADNYPAYQWYNEDGMILGAIQREYIINQPGEYYLETINENGCLNTSAIVNINYTSLDTNPFLNFTYEIIPNPNIGEFTFRFETSIDLDFVLVLTNSNGQIIAIRNLNAKEVNYEVQFDVSHLSKGVYNLIISVGGQQKTEKIVVQ